MPNELHLDYETRSRLDLSVVGGYKYARHPSTEITHAAWRIDGGDMQSWHIGQPLALLMPLFNVLMAWKDKPQRYYKAHNAAFERYITNYVLPRQFPDLFWIDHMPPECWDCTMARSLAFGLPGGMDKVAAALKLGTEKLKEGKSILSKYYTLWEVPEKLWYLYLHEQTNGVTLNEGDKVFRGDEITRPNGRKVSGGQNINRKVTAAEYRNLSTLRAASRIFEERDADGLWATRAWRNNPEDLKAISEYNIHDVVIEEKIDKRLPALNATEFRIWCLDQEINERGVPIDVERVKLLADTVSLATERANCRLCEITAGEVSAITQVASISEYLSRRGYDISAFTKDLLAGYLEEADARGDETAKEVISLRDENAKASVKKLYSMLAQVNEDNFIRDNLQYYGAATGRWAGRGVQMQNIARLNQTSLANIEDVLALGGGDPEEVLVQADVLEIPIIADIGAATRSMLKAPDGMYFIGGDFSNIEGRVNCWLADETWKIQAFRDFDTFLTDEYGNIKRDEKGEPMRKGLDLYKLAFAKGDKVAAKLVGKDDRQKGKAQELALGYQGGPNAFLTFAKNLGFYVPEREAEQLVADWRSAHPRIVGTWWELQDAAISAVQNPGIVYPAAQGRVRYKCQGNVLYCGLPSGRNLVYPYAELEYEERFGKSRPKVVYMGVNSKTRKWGKLGLYGGLQCENIVQALARDIMASAMFGARDAGFNLVLTVHDELLAIDENPEREHELKEIMSIVPDWAEGLPLAAECWSDIRYVK